VRLTPTDLIEPEIVRDEIEREEQHRTPQRIKQTARAQAPGEAKDYDCKKGNDACRVCRTKGSVREPWQQGTGL